MFEDTSLGQRSSSLRNISRYPRNCSMTQVRWQYVFRVGRYSGAVRSEAIWFARYDGVAEAWGRPRSHACRRERGSGRRRCTAWNRPATAVPLHRCTLPAPEGDGLLWSPIGGVTLSYRWSGSHQDGRADGMDDDGRLLIRVDDPALTSRPRCCRQLARGGTTRGRPARVRVSGGTASLRGRSRHRTRERHPRGMSHRNAG